MFGLITGLLIVHDELSIKRKTKEAQAGSMERIRRLNDSLAKNKELREKKYYQDGNTQ